MLSTNLATIFVKLGLVVLKSLAHSTIHYICKFTVQTSFYELVQFMPKKQESFNTIIGA